MAEKTILDFPAITDFDDDDVLYVVRGTGAGRDKSITGSVIKNYTKKFETIKLISTATYTILNTDLETIFECDSTLNNVAITLPDLVSNYGKKYYISHNVQGSSNIVTVNRAGSDVITRDSLTSIELPSEGNYIELYASQQAGAWIIKNESITCDLRLDTYAGYGSTDIKIMRFTNERVNIGNCFSENHSTGYNGNTEGLEITINKSGKYAFSYSCQASSGGSTNIGLSLNSSQLTTNINSINIQYRLCMTGPATSALSSCSWEGYLNFGDIIRSHAQGSIPDSSSFCHFQATYQG